jgi:hypothetical protein
MPNAPQIRSRLAEWIDGRISLSAFEDWFVPATWNIHKENDSEAENLADEIELSLSEYSGGYLSIAELRESLEELTLPFSTGESSACPVVIAKPQEISFTRKAPGSSREIEPISPPPDRLVEQELAFHA